MSLTYLKVPDRPYDWEENCPAAQQIYKNKDLLPPVVPGLSLLGLLDNNVGDIGDHLDQQRNIVEATSSSKHAPISRDSPEVAEPP